MEMSDVTNLNVKEAKTGHNVDIPQRIRARWKEAGRSSVDVCRAVPTNLLSCLPWNELKDADV